MKPTATLIFIIIVIIIVVIYLIVNLRAEIDFIYGFLKRMYSFKIGSIGRETISHTSYSET